MLAPFNFRSRLSLIIFWASHVLNFLLFSSIIRPMILKHEKQNLGKATISSVFELLCV